MCIPPDDSERMKQLILHKLKEVSEIVALELLPPIWVVATVLMTAFAAVVCQG